MSILVTGAAGFIGHHLVRELKAAGFNVVALDKVDLGDLLVDQLSYDITDEQAMLSLPYYLQTVEPITTCIHLAAIAAPRVAQRDPQLAWSTNVHGTYNVLQLLKQIKCRRMIFFSSAHVYGISPKYMPTDENHPVALHDTYTSTKVIGERLCQLFYENHGISYTVLRLFNGYGPGQNEDYFMGAKLKQAAAGGPVTLQNADVTKDWIYIDDIVRAARLAIDTEFCGPINIGTGVETRLGTIGAAIADHYGVETLADPTPDDSPTRMCCDNSRARTTLRWEPRVMFAEGLSHVIEAWRKK